MVNVPPSVPRSIMPPACVHEKAWTSASPAIVLCPTISPLAFTAAASLHVPPSVPRSSIPAARAAGVHGAPDVERAPERPKVDLPAGRRPREGVGFGIAGDGASPDDLAARVHVGGVAERAPERPEIEHPARSRPGECVDLKE